MLDLKDVVRVRWAVVVKMCDISPKSVLFAQDNDFKDSFIFAVSVKRS